MWIESLLKINKSESDGLDQTEPEQCIRILFIKNLKILWITKLGEN